MKTTQKFLQTGLFTILFILMSMTVFSQEEIMVKNILAVMSKGTQNCYLVEIPQGDLDIIQMNWKKKLQEGGKLKVKEVNNELVFAGAVKTELTYDTVNIYTILIPKEDARIVMNVFVEINDVFFSPKDDKTDLASDKIDNNIRNYLRSFAVDQYKLAVGHELQGHQEVLETLQNDLKKLIKDEENMTKENSSLENDIDKTEREISNIDKNIDLKNQEIISHSASVETLVMESDKKAAQAKQKDLEKEKNQLEKSRSKSKDDISSYKSKIKKNEKAIEDGKTLQEQKTTEINKQTEVVAQVQARLDGIK
jgi:predicted  nucleic acid-binding Zn-ribbon protein